MNTEQLENKPKFAQLWPNLIKNEELIEFIKDAVVERVELSRQQKSALVCFYTIKPIPLIIQQKIAHALTAEFANFNVILSNFFCFENITTQTVLDLVEELKAQRLPINGFIIGANIQIDMQTGDVATISITVKNGLNILSQIKFSEKLQDIILEKTNTKVRVKLICNEQISVADVEKTMLKKAPVKVFKPKNSGAVISIKGVELTQEPSKVMFGQSFTTKNKQVTSLFDITSADGQCIVWGDVFFTDLRDNWKKIYTISITDYKGSVNLKIILDAGSRTENLDSISQGMTIVARGSFVYDKYEKDYVFYPNDILQVVKKVRTDDAPQKRVELHLHTKLSNMDALIDVKKAINTAHSLGHRAIAITDHGVVQAFPEAMGLADKIRKDDPDFKVIYGVEAYFVDDMIPVVYGNADGDVNQSMVVFDLETTGFSPFDDRMTEIGAVVIENGQVLEEFNTFVNPKKHIPEKVTKITGITDDMVKDAPEERQALREFLNFVNGRILIAHNAHSFDMRFLQECAKRCKIKLPHTYIDTLPMAQTLCVGLKNYKLDTITKSLGVPSFNHHRASDDAKALAQAFVAMLSELKNKKVQKIEDINTGLASGRALSKKNSHIILLVKNQGGMKNLYKIISSSHIDYFLKVPRVPRSLLNKHRHGLIVGSACEAGELYRAIVEGKKHEELKRIAAYYDYLEVQPVGNNEYMVREGIVDSKDKIRAFNKTIIDLGKQLGKPVVATGDVHFLNPEDSVYRAILQAGMGFDDADNQAPLYFRTTQEMLDEFKYLPDEVAYEIVVTNPGKIADTIESDIRVIPRGLYSPKIEGADESLREDTMTRAKQIYGDPLPQLVEERLTRELDSIIKHGFAVLYVIAQKLVKKSEEYGYLVGSRGSVGSSAVAHFSGISEVNSLPPHYVCSQCKWSEFFTDGSVADGFDLENKKCPMCNTELIVDGHDIPFETFLGFDGDKEPDIDLNFSGEVQGRIHKYTEDLFGKDNVFKAGTISGLKDKTAYGYVKKYLDERGKIVNKAEENRLVLGCVDVKKTTGQHPGGMVVVPENYEVCDFCPVQHPSDDKEKGVVTTHFEYKYLHETILKLDELGHFVPTMYKYLEDMTGIKMESVPMNDEKVLSLLISTDAFNVSSEDIDSKTGTFGIPELGTSFVRNMLIEAQPKNFGDLIQISGLSHGTDVWNGNAQNLIKDKICTISEVIATRDSIMTYLMHMGVKAKDAFKIMEMTRKGVIARAGFPEGMEKMLKEHNVPQWYIDSCKKIQYMFPKAHAVAYLISAMRIMWFKLYYPLQFYAAYFTIHGEDIDYEAAMGGAKVAKQNMKQINIRIKEEKKAKDENLLSSLQIVNEMLCRGYSFLPIKIGKSKASEYTIEDDKIRLPFMAIKGIGETAAEALERATINGQQYLSAEELQINSGITDSVIDALTNINALGDMPRSNQVSFF